MKCTWCKTRLADQDRREGRWTYGDQKSGVGFFVCTRCDKALVHRYKINWVLPLALFLAGALSPGVFGGVILLLYELTELGEATSFLIAAAVSFALIAVLWFLSFQAVEVRGERRVGH